MFSDGAGVQELPTGGTFETQLVVDVAQTFHLLSKVHVLVASQANTGHSGALFVFFVICKSKNFENGNFSVTIL